MAPIIDLSVHFLTQSAYQDLPSPPVVFYVKSFLWTSKNIPCTLSPNTIQSDYCIIISMVGLIWLLAPRCLPLFCPPGVGPACEETSGVVHFHWDLPWALKSTSKTHNYWPPISFILCNSSLLFTSVLRPRGIRAAHEKTLGVVPGPSLSRPRSKYRDNVYKNTKDTKFQLTIGPQKISPAFCVILKNNRSLFLVLCKGLAWQDANGRAMEGGS